MSVEIRRHAPLARLCALAALFAVVVLPSGNAWGGEGRFYVRSEALFEAQKSGAMEFLEVDGLRLRVLLPERALGKLAPADARALAPLRRWFTLDLPEAELAAARVSLETAPGIDRVEPAYDHFISERPDDPRSLTQTHLPLTSAFEAYDILKGEQGDVVVGIVDGGSEWRHEDLEDNVYLNPDEIPENGIDDDDNGFVDDYVGWDFPADDGDPTGSPETPRNARHGTHIAGIVGAVTDNGIGVAGVSWNSRVLLVNAGTNDADSDGAIRYGYQGLLYAAMNGADIVNLSWGRSSGRWSEFEHEVIRAVDALGVLIVAAAGNMLERQPFYPAYYPEVLSVTATTLALRHPFWANSDGWIDLSAPGDIIWSTDSNGGYRTMSGTSQASAIVSGVAALLKTQRPEWDPLRMRQQLRWTASDISSLNPAVEFGIGTGNVDAANVLGELGHGSWIESIENVTSGVSPLPERASEVGLRFHLHNELKPTNSLLVRMSIQGDLVIPLRTAVRLGPLGAPQSLTVQPGLSYWLPDNATYGQLIPVLLELIADERSVHQMFYVESYPLHDVVESAELQMTHTLNGRLGYSQFLRDRDPGGTGLGRRGERSRILGGTLLLGTGPDQVADALIQLSNPLLFRDFRAPIDVALQAPEDGLSDVVRRSFFSDTGMPAPIGWDISQLSRAFMKPANGNFLLSSYELRARDRDIRGARVGILLDVELSSIGVSEADELFFDEAYSMLVARAPAGDWVGIAVLHAPGSVGWNWLHDLRPDEDDGVPFLYDGSNLSHSPSDPELWALMSSSPPEGFQPRGGIAGVLHVGPFDASPGSRRRLQLAYVMGADLASLRIAAESAATAQRFIDEGVPTGPEAGARLLSNVPNPFNPRTDLRLSLPRAGHVRLSIYDTRGRLVRVLHDGQLPSGLHRIPWNGENDRGQSVASGVYFAAMETEAGMQSSRLTLIR